MQRTLHPAAGLFAISISISISTSMSISSLAPPIFGTVAGCGRAGSEHALEADKDGGVADAHAPDRGGIRGKIIDRYGRDVDSAKVIVGGESAVTKYDGTFVLRTEPEKYDLLVANWEETTVVEVIGLTRKDPVVQLPVRELSATRMSVSGRMPSIGAGWLAGLAYSTPGFHTINAVSIAAEGPATHYSTHLDKWLFDAGPATFWLFVLSGDPARFRGYASRTTTLNRAALTADVDFGPITPVTSGTIHGRLEIPSDFVLDIAYLAGFVRPPDSEEWLEVSWADVSKGNPAASCPVPAIEGAEYAAALRAIGRGSDTGEIFSTWKRLPLGGEHAATFVRAGEVSRAGDGRFVVDGSPEGARVFSFESFADVSVYVFTEASSAKVPDLSALGIAAPAGRSCRVSTFPDIRTTDSMTDPNALPDLDPRLQVVRGLEGGTHVSRAGGS